MISLDRAALSQDIHRVNAELRKIDREAAKQSMFNAAKIVQNAAKPLTPKRTGKLRHSVRIVGRSSVGSRARYAGYVHFGTRRSAKGGSVYHSIGLAAKTLKAMEQGGVPYVYAAIDQKLPEIVASLEADLAATTALQQASKFPGQFRTGPMSSAEARGMGISLGAANRNVLIKHRKLATRERITKSRKLTGASFRR